MPSSRSRAAATWPSIRQAECVLCLFHCLHTCPARRDSLSTRTRSQGLSPPILQEFTRQREVMVTVERGLLHALAFDFNVDVPYPFAWRYLDALVGESVWPCTV